MLVAFNKDFAGRKKGDVSTIPDGMAKVLIKKGYVKVTGDEPVKKLAPSSVPPKPRKPRTPKK